MESLVIVIVLIVAIGFVGRVVMGLIRWLILLALGTFLIVFLFQPVHTSPIVRAQTAAHTVIGRTRAVSQVVIPRWQQIWHVLAQTQFPVEPPLIKSLSTHSPNKS